jgi:HK97 family phage portal protein
MISLSGLASRFRGLFRVTDLPPRYSDGWQAGTHLDDTTRPGDVGGIAALSAGMRIIAGQLLVAPMLSFEGRKETPDSPAARCLRATMAQDFEAAFFDAVSTGNGWLKIIRTNGSPISLEHVQAHRMSAQITVDGQVEYLLDMAPVDYSTMVHFMARNHYSRFVGESIVATNSVTAEGVLSSYQILRTLQNEGTFADQYLATDAVLQKEAVQRLREIFDEQTKLLKGSRGTPILTSGLKPIVARTKPSAVEADLIKALEFSVSECSRMTGVPLSFLGVKDAVAYSSAIEESRTFYRNTLRPLLFKIERELSLKLGADIRHDQGEISLGYGSERAETLSKLLNAGILSPNEARQAVGFSPVQYGDTIGRPANTVELSNWIDMAPGAPAPGQAPEADGTKQKRKLELLRHRTGI